MAKKRLSRKELKRTRGGLTLPAPPKEDLLPPPGGSAQISEVKVRGWDPAQSKEIVGKG